MFRNLQANEIECRIGTCNEKGVSLLLYKDARCDMRILDETVGAFGWQCKYSEHKGTLFCAVGLAEKTEAGKVWHWKEDAGAPSNMEAQKGEASDAFKRACFRWGIGRELYTAPFIWVNASNCTIKQGRNGKLQCFDRFEVEAIKVDQGRIVGLCIRNAKTRQRVFTYCEPGYEKGANNGAA